MRRLFFICNALDDATRLERKIVTDSPAASRKVFLLSRALRDAGVRAWVVSLGRGKQDGSGQLFRTKVSRVNGMPVIYLPFIHKRLISELFSLFFSVPVLWRLKRFSGEKTALFYNRLPAYFLALIYARLLRFRTVLDLEDGATDLRGWTLTSIRARVFARLFDSLCSGGALLACEALAETTQLRPVQCCYGTTELISKEGARDTSILTVLLGGTVSQDTGAPLLVDAIRLLRKEAPSWAAQIRFEITGKGDSLNDFIELATDPRHPSVIVHGRTNDDEYKQILSRTDIGLALKPIAGKYADTTFPSKVIEFASQHILVLTTDISDVRKVLSDGALYLTVDDPRHLLDRLQWVVENQEKISVLSQKAAHAIATLCLPEVVGADLANFLFASNNGRRP